MSARCGIERSVRTARVCAPQIVPPSTIFHRRFRIRMSVTAWHPAFSYPSSAPDNYIALLLRFGGRKAQVACRIPLLSLLVNL